MTHSVRWDINEEPITNAAALAAFFDEQLQMVNPFGTRSVSVWLGPEGAKRRDMPLRLDLDPDTGLAAVRWLPDHTHATEPGIEPRDITVCEASDKPMITIPAAIAQVSITTARTIANDYVQGDQKPNIVTWQLTLDIPIVGSELREVDAQPL